MRWRYPFTERLELSRHLIPGVALNHERPPGLAEFGSSRFVVQEVDHRCSEIRGIVRGYEFFLVSQCQPLGSDRRGDDRFGHAECLKNFHARTAARTQRNDVDRGLVQIRPHVVYRASHNHA